MSSDIAQVTPTTLDAKAEESEEKVRAILDALRLRSPPVVWDESGADPHQSGTAGATAESIGFWKWSFEGLLLDAPPSAHGQGQDDLLFFVTPRAPHQSLLSDSMAEEADRAKHEGDEPCIFLRRWAPDISKYNLQDRDIDWRRTVYLNLVAHSSYTLTVAVVSKSVLGQSRRTTESGSPGSRSPTADMHIHRVKRVVYASPSFTTVNRRDKDADTLISYPDISFAVDDFHEAFENTTISDPDHCFCVRLNSTNSPNGPAVVNLFAGFVSFDALQKAYWEGHGRVRGLLAPLTGEDTTVVMRGPGGHGQADVCVRALGNSNRKGLAGLIGNVAQYRGVKGFQVSLMSIRLPWQQLARDLLFQQSS